MSDDAQKEAILKMALNIGSKVDHRHDNLDFQNEVRALGHYVGSLGNPSFDNLPFERTLHGSARINSNFLSFYLEGVNAAREQRLRLVGLPVKPPTRLEVMSARAGRFRATKPRACQP